MEEEDLSPPESTAEEVTLAQQKRACLKNDNALVESKNEIEPEDAFDESTAAVKVLSDSDEGPNNYVIKPNFPESKSDMDEQSDDQEGNYCRHGKRRSECLDYEQSDDEEGNYCRHGKRRSECLDYEQSDDEEGNYCRHGKRRSECLDYDDLVIGFDVDQSDVSDDSAHLESSVPKNDNVLGESKNEIEHEEGSTFVEVSSDSEAEEGPNNDVIKLNFPKSQSNMDEPSDNQEGLYDIYGKKMSECLEYDDLTSGFDADQSDVSEDSAHIESGVPHNSDSDSDASDDQRRYEEAIKNIVIALIIFLLMLCLIFLLFHPIILWWMDHFFARQANILNQYFTSMATSIHTAVEEINSEYQNLDQTFIMDLVDWSSYIFRVLMEYFH